MASFRPRRRLIGPLLLMAAFTLGTTLGPGVVAAAQNTVQSVFVTNTATSPVPVAGTVAVGNTTANPVPITGTAAGGTIAVNGTVAVDTSQGPVPVAPQTTTQLIDHGDFGLAAASTHEFSSTPYDVSAYRTVRITVEASTSCTQLYFQVLLPMGVYFANATAEVDETLPASCVGTWTLDVPGTAIRVQLFNTSTTTVFASYAIFGRR